MKPQPELPLPSEYLHQVQTRSDKEILLTNKLAMALSELNIKRVMAKSTQDAQRTKSSVKFFFVCICGIPPFEDEYQSLQLPGQKAVVSLSGLRGQYTQQEYIDLFKQGGFENEARKIRQLVLPKSDSGYRVVVLYHSFGTFSLVNYLRLYGQDHRIAGLIDIGGASIRFYPLLRNFIRENHSISHQYLLHNADEMHQRLQSNPDRVKAGFNSFRNKYQSILHLKLATEESFQQMFELFRHLPGVLKAFVYGANDRIFPEHLVNEKAIHYSYASRFDLDYEGRVREAYRQCYGVEVENVQERFIFRVEGGSHSIHMQARFGPLLRAIVSQYLQVLEKALAE